MPKPTLTLIKSDTRPAVSHTGHSSQILVPRGARLSFGKDWPPVMSVVDHVVPFVVTTSDDFIALQFILNRSIRRLSLYVDLDDSYFAQSKVEPDAIDRFLQKRIILPTGDGPSYLVNIHGCLDLFFCLARSRPLSENRQVQYYERGQRLTDFRKCGLPSTNLSVGPLSLSPRPERGLLLDSPRSRPDNQRTIQLHLLVLGHDRWLRSPLHAAGAINDSSAS